MFFFVPDGKEYYLLITSQNVHMLKNKIHRFSNMFAAIRYLSFLSNNDLRYFSYGEKQNPCCLFTEWLKAFY